LTSLSLLPAGRNKIRLKATLGGYTQSGAHMSLARKSTFFSVTSPAFSSICHRQSIASSSFPSRRSLCRADSCSGVNDSATGLNEGEAASSPGRLVLRVNLILGAPDMLLRCWPGRLAVLAKPTWDEILKVVLLNDYHKFTSGPRPPLDNPGNDPAFARHLNALRARLGS